MTAGVGGLHGGADGDLAVGEHEGTACTLVSSPEHPLAKDTGHRPDDIAHGLEFPAGNLVIIPEAQSVRSEDRADGTDIPLLPRREHPGEALLRMVNVSEPAAEGWVRFPEPREDRFMKFPSSDIA